LEYRGFGTEKVEDELSMLMPEARLSRMDLDTTRSRNSLQNISASDEVFRSRTRINFGGSPGERSYSAN